MLNSDVVCCVCLVVWLFGCLFNFFEVNVHPKIQLRIGIFSEKISLFSFSVIRCTQRSPSSPFSGAPGRGVLPICVGSALAEWTLVFGSNHHSRRGSEIREPLPVLELCTIAMLYGSSHATGVHLISRISLTNNAGSLLRKLRAEVPLRSPNPISHHSL